MTRKGAGTAKTATLKRRTFTREFELQVIRSITNMVGFLMEHFAGALRSRALIFL